MADKYYIVVLGPLATKDGAKTNGEAVKLSDEAAKPLLSAGIVKLAPEVKPASKGKQDTFPPGDSENTGSKEGETGSSETKP